ncbi:hypothetical protein OG455_16080 [Kitasatospora sp. NBC_01287]|uniref:hypothetical protein n=1 Tax=Kitasatospora sp. NBC_01287 TaxID=2903573 RepID=UPI002254CDEF|nr:hypothetical protein [Kitasatospora sp. NBC_01287]MCX4747027.1 hypothetical protein [Kitasatospora sp. NBC_01287]
MSPLHRVTACAVALLAVAALGGCRSGATTGSTSGSGHAAGGGATGPGAAPGAPGPAAAQPAARWVMTMPDTVAGHPKITPSAAQLKQITDSWAGSQAKVHAGGQVVVGVYDDPAEDAWLIVTGVNGSGFDPAAVSTLSTAPAATRDGQGDAVTNTFKNVDPGPHGGTDTCDEQLDEARTLQGTIAAEDTTCFWMTPSTFGAITFYNKKDDRITIHDVSITPDVAGPIMLSVRDDVEHQG